MIQAVSRRLLTAEALVRCCVTLCEIFGGPSGIGIGFPSSIAVLTCRHYSTNAPYSCSSAEVWIREAWEPSKKQFLSKIVQHWMKMCFHL